MIKFFLTTFLSASSVWAYSTPIQAQGSSQGFCQASTIEICLQELQKESESKGKEELFHTCNFHHGYNTNEECGTSCEQHESQNSDRYLHLTCSSLCTADCHTYNEF